MSPLYCCSFLSKSICFTDLNEIKIRIRGIVLFYGKKKFSCLSYKKCFDFTWGTTACLMNTSKRNVTHFVIASRDTQIRKGGHFFRFVFIFENLVIVIQTLFVLRLRKLIIFTTLLRNF